MKKRLTSPTFDASAKTVVHASFSDITLAGIQLITNVTDNIVIYNFADPTKGGTLSTDTLTLAYDTTTMSDTDELMVLVEDGSATEAIAGTVDLGATDNAVLDAIAASVAAIDTDTTTVIGHLDGVETLLGTIDADTSNLSTKIDTLAGAVAGTEVQVDVLTMPTTTVTATDLDIRNLVNTDVVTAELSATDNAVLDAIAASVAAIDTDATTIIGHVDGIETAIGTTNTTLTTIDGRVDGLETSNSAIQTAVELIDNTIVVDDAAFAPATTSVQMVGFVFDNVATDSVDEGDAGAARMSANRNIFTTVRDAAGNERGQNVDANGNAGVVLAAETTKVIGTIRVASGGIASGAIAAGAIAAGATSIATTEDTASAAADHLVKVAQIRLDTPVSGANLSASGDYTQFIADSFGKTWTAGTYPEDLAHVAGEPIRGNGTRRIDTPASSAGTSGDWATMDASAEGALWTTNTPTTTGGCTIFRSIDLDETEEEIKATAGNLYGYYFANTNAAARYLKFYNATAANVTVGSTTPVLTFYLPPTSAGHVGFAFPIGFATAITAAATTGVADADTGAPSANDVILNVFYK